MLEAFKLYILKSAALHTMAAHLTFVEKNFS